MPHQTLLQHRTELSAKLGFSQQAGSEIILESLLNSFLQRAQQNILSEYGSQLDGTVWPATDFLLDADTSSVPDNYLHTSALLRAQEYYRQPMSATVDAKQNYERNARGIVG